MSFMARSAKHFMVIKAAREIKKEIEKAGLDNLKFLCENGISIVGTYLNALPSKEKEQRRREFGILLRMGVTLEMVLDEVARQMSELAPIIKERPDYKKAELEKVGEFLKGA